MPIERRNGGSVVILAFLQNQWFYDPARMQAIYQRHGNTPEKRAELNATYLFMGCLTGQRLQGAFGELCESMIWENASTLMGDRPSKGDNADPLHMTRCINHFKPDIILVFGKVAQEGLAIIETARDALYSDFRITGAINFRTIIGPHPAARGADVTVQLVRMAHELKGILCDAEI
jgi:hypothetical protein